VHDRGVQRRQLGGERDRVGLQADDAVAAVDENLYRSPAPTPGTKSSQIPADPSERIGCTRSFQKLKSATTATERAFGAQTANAVPVTPSISRTCAPSRR
jgi:hypothetical protein